MKRAIILFFVFVFITLMTSSCMVGLSRDDHDRNRGDHDNGRHLGNNHRGNYHDNGRHRDDQTTLIIR